MRFLHNILAKAGLIVDGVTQLNTIANATIDTDKFLVSDGGVIKYRTGAQLGSDIGAANIAASTLKHQVKLGEAINKGQAVYVSSADGTNMIVSKASNASEATSSKTLGLIETSGVLNDQVNVITEGLLAGLDTSTAAAGDPVWLGTNGNIIFGLPNKPYAPAHLVFIGIVTRVQQNNGEIFVKVQNGFELKEIHDVQITTTPSDNTVLAYESATSLYKMKSIATLLGYTPANAARQLTINGTTYDLTADRIWSVGTVTSIATTGPITGGTITGSGTIGITQATTSSNGYLSSTDWNTFNNKQNALTLTTTGSSGASTLVGATLNIPTYSLSGLGGVPSSRQLTINGTAYDLSTDRSWSVGTVTSVGVSVPTGLSVSNTPVTGSGTIAISFTAGYSIPTTASQTNWDTAYNNRITSLTTTGTSGAATLTSNTLNIPQYQAQGSYITSLTGEATASGPGAASVTLTNSAVIGKVLTGLNVTGGTVLATDSILTAFGKLQNQVNGLAGGVTYQGTWNASTNSPSLTSSVGTKGYYYVVSVAGSTNLNGITDWKLGDWVIFNGTAWEKVDNTDAVVSVNGFTGAVSLTTSNISEGTNLYYTDTRARAAISLTTTGSSGAATYIGGVINVPQYTLAGLGGEPAIAAGTTSQYWRGDKSWQTLNTTVVTEGTNLYYTDARARAAITLTTTGTSGAATYSGGVLNIPQYQSVLTNPVTGTGTTNYITKWTSGSAVGNSQIFDNGNNVLYGTTSSTGYYTSDVIGIAGGKSITIDGAYRNNWGADATTPTSTTFQSRLNIWTANSDHITLGGSNTVIRTAWEDFYLWINNDSASTGTLHLQHTSSQVEFARFAGSGWSWVNNSNFGINNSAASARLEINTPTAGYTGFTGSTVQGARINTLPGSGQSTALLLTQYLGDLSTDTTVDVDFAAVDSNSVLGAYPHVRIGYTGAYNGGINTSPEYEARGYFRIATRGEGSAGVLADRLLIDYTGTLRLLNYTTNGFLKFSNSDGTVTVDTNTYLTAESDTLASVTGRGATTSNQVILNGGIRMGNAYLNPSGDLNHFHFNGTAIIPNTTTTASNASMGTSAYRWSSIYGGGLDISGSATISSSLTANSIIKSGGTSSQFLKADGSVDSNSYITSASVGNGTLTLNVSGSGLSGSTSFTANQSGNTTFTVTSNATTSATANTIAYRDSGGDLYARYFFGSYVNTSDNDETGITRFVIKNGDNYHRSATTTTAMTVIRGVASGTWGIDISGNSATTTNFRHLGAGVSYDNDRTMKTSGGLAVYAAYSGGSNSPTTYDVAAQFSVNGNRGFEISADWISTAGPTLYARSLRDCCQNWSSWITILTSLNYNSYSPTLTGGGASGTWGISISGNSATTSQTNFSALTVNSATVATQSWVQSQGYVTGGPYLPLSGGTMTGDIIITGQRVKDLTSTNKGVYIGNWFGAGYWGLGSTSNTHELKLDQVDVNGVWQSATDVNLYLGTRLVLNSSNYNSYSPTLTGGGASGTWGISISGNSATTSQTNFSSLTINSATVATQSWVTSQGYITSTNTDFTYNASLTLSTSWQDTGVSNSNLTTNGVYLLTCFVNDFAVGGSQYSVTYTGIMYWYASSTNDVSYAEIPLHHLGHADNDRYIYLRTRNTFSAGGTFLQICGNGNNSGASTYTFSFKRLM